MREKSEQASAAAIAAERAKQESDARLDSAKLAAERLKLEQDTQAAAAAREVERLKLENDARLAASKSEADRMQRENEARLAASKSEADRLQRENEAQRAASQAALDAAAKKMAELEAQKVELRGQLFKQFNAILHTQDTARGLIVNMDDVLFDTAKFTLRPLAREKLAKVAGIVSGHPGLRLDVEGHTDSVGSDEYNQKLSEERGEAVRSFLTAQGMASSAVTSKGLGKKQPIATNDTAKGRQQNRRVELVVSGEVIGTKIGMPTTVR